MKRPMLTAEDKARLRRMAANAERNRAETGTNQAYAKGVSDVLRWIASNEDPTPLLKEVTR